VTSWLFPRRAPLAPLIDVHEQRNGRCSADVQLVLEQTRRAADHLTERRKLRQLGRDYGRASRTIHALRAECALLREGLRDATERLADEQAVVEEMEAALRTAEGGRAIDPDELADLLQKSWFETRPHVPFATDVDRRWRAVAETAIDAVRGLLHIPAQAIRRDIVARILDAHTLNPASMPGTCRCGWDGYEIHHVDHVAEQLLAVGGA
jgi:hypothetical protein